MSNVRSTPIPTTSSVVNQYRRGRAAASLAALIFIFGALFVLNGYFTVRAVLAFSAARGLGLNVWAGILAHIVMAVVELSLIFASPHLRGMPLILRIIVWLVVLPFGIFDVWSSTTGLLDVAVRLHLTLMPWIHIITTVLAEGLAFAPEPIIIWLLVAFSRMARDQ